MQTIRIFRDDVPDGVVINEKDFDPNIHRKWVEPVSELPQTVEIAGLVEPIDPPAINPPSIAEHHKKSTKRAIT